MVFVVGNRVAVLVNGLCDPTERVVTEGLSLATWINHLGHSRQVDNTLLSVVKKVAYYSIFHRSIFFVPMSCIGPHQNQCQTN